MRWTTRRSFTSDRRLLRARGACRPEPSGGCGRERSAPQKGEQLAAVAIARRLEMAKRRELQPLTQPLDPLGRGPLAKAEPGGDLAGRHAVAQPDRQQPVLLAARRAERLGQATERGRERRRIVPDAARADGVIGAAGIDGPFLRVPRVLRQPALGSGARAEAVEHPVPEAPRQIRGERPRRRPR